MEMFGPRSGSGLTSWPTGTSTIGYPKAPMARAISQRPIVPPPCPVEGDNACGYVIISRIESHDVGVVEQTWKIRGLRCISLMLMRSRPTRLRSQAPDRVCKLAELRLQLLPRQHLRRYLLFPVVRALVGLPPVRSRSQRSNHPRRESQPEQSKPGTFDRRPREWQMGARSQRQPMSKRRW